MKVTYKHLLFLFLWCMGMAPLYGQKIKYSRDIYPLIQEGNYLQAYRMLHIYLQKEPDAINAYYQLARISEQRANRFDPLLQGHIVMRYADSCIYYFSEFDKRLTEKELRKNAEYYEDFFDEEDKASGKPKIEINEVKPVIEQKIAHYRRLKENLSTILRHFGKAVEHYDASLRLYNGLTEQYYTYKELLILADENVIETLNRLALHYDSTVYYLDRYRRALDQYPLEGYNQRYTVRPIVDFRIDGVEPFVDFLRPDIQLWNYAQWARQTVENIQKEIKPLKQSLAAAFKEAIQAADNKQSYEIDRPLLLKLNRYDYNSLISNLIEYYAHKSAYAQAEQIAKLETNLDAREEAQRFSELLFYGGKAKEALSASLAAANEKNFKKYETILNSRYTSLNTLRQALSQEDAWINQEVRRLETEVKDQINRLLESMPVTSYENVPLPTTPNWRPLDEVKEGEWVVAESVKDGAGNYYLCGFRRAANDQLTGFVVKISEGKVVWMHQEKESEAQTSTAYTSLTLTEDGCLVTAVACATGPYSIQKAAIERFSNAGKRIEKVPLPFTDCPRFIRYNDVFGYWTLLAKGQALFDPATANEKVLLIEAKASNGQLNWQQEFRLLGNVVNLVPVERGYVVIGNFSEISFPDGEKAVSRVNNLAHHTNVFAVKYSSKLGNITRRNYYPSKQPLAVYQVYKASDKAIHLLGSMGTWKFQTFRFNPSESLHLIIDSELDFYYPFQKP
ncbi:MAG: hypothetical protein KatS3mg033_0235 [Thermonema sp.]|uniref:hypothetical protein n=1 Tax=Thermonema sp. TaxID=2231181 RepID=UPI0021DBF988|nr:hypothetical protein [Thermonema sp.]GIV38435.1 MAG: hypothetical protein KatS3mg033_0235 [Thermonema sp.]